ncbi:hypothetical protein CHI08_22710 [Peribacillus simplex]|nr:hypothetical protein CHI08_22710 [Peribacillus simplex]
MENFFSHFKSECFYMNSFGTSEEVRGAVSMYIRIFNSITIIASRKN